MRHGTHFSIRSIFVGVAGAVICLATARLVSAAPTEVAQYDSACTSDEAWKFGRNVPKYYANQFSKGFSAKNLFQTMLLADLLRDTARAPDVRYLAEYFLYRAFYEMKLIHLAHNGFVSLAMKPLQPGTFGVQAAAVSCLNRIHEQYASLFPSGVTVQQLQLFGRTPAATEAAANLAKLAIARPDLSASLNSDLQFIEGSRTHQSLLKILESADQGQEKDLIRGVIQLFRSYPYPKGFNTDPDRIYLLLGQAFYDIGNYERAIRSFRRVRNTSNYFVDALNDLAWAYLQRDDYSNAIAASQNMIVGGLRDVYTPEANLVVAIALNETCNYAEAIDSIRYFKRSYGRVNKWLQDWRGQQVQAPVNLYRYLAAYLKKKDSNVPDRIATEWLRSPVFIASQDELNLLKDEQPATRRLYTRTARAMANKRDPRWISVRKDLQAMLIQEFGRIDHREAYLVASVNADLVARTNRMISTLSEVSQNMQLVEAEIYNSISERMISDYARPDQNRAPADAIKKNTGKSAGAVWDWGKFDADDSNAEVWDDEIGFLRTDIGSKCVKR